MIFIYADCLTSLYDSWHNESKWNFKKIVLKFLTESFSYMVNYCACFYVELFKQVSFAHLVDDHTS